jgi:hypothetical protein
LGSAAAGQASILIGCRTWCRVSSHFIFLLRAQGLLDLLAARFKFSTHKQESPAKCFQVKLIRVLSCFSRRQKSALRFLRFHFPCWCASVWFWVAAHVSVWSRFCRYRRPRDFGAHDSFVAFLWFSKFPARCVRSPASIPTQARAWSADGPVLLLGFLLRCRVFFPACHSHSLLFFPFFSFFIYGTQPAASF